MQCDIQRLRAQKHRRGRRQGRQRRARALREGRQGVLRALGEVRRSAAAREPAAAVRASSTRSSTTRRAPSRPARLIAKSIRAPHGAARIRRYRPRQDRAREGRDVRDRRKLPGHRRLRPGVRLVRAVREGEPARGKDADKALSDAVVLRLGLGQEDQAIEDVRPVQRRTTAARTPAQTAQIAFAIGAHYADKEDWDKARKRALRRDGHASTRRRRTSRSRRTRRSRARSCTLKAETQRAGRVRQGPQALGRPAAPPRRRSTTPTRPRARTSAPHRIGKALDAVGEAYVLRRRRQEAREGRYDHVPRLQGPGHQGRRQEAHPDQA